MKRTKEERAKGPSELGGLSESMLKAIRIHRGEDPERVLNAPKTRSFANNLSFPDRETTVTLDQHAARAALGIGRENYSKSTQGILRELDDVKQPEGIGASADAFLADIYKRLAAKHGVLSHQAQAVIWVSQKHIADEIEAEQKATKKAKGDAEKAAKLAADNAAAFAPALAGSFAAYTAERAKPTEGEFQGGTPSSWPRGKVD